MPVHPTVKNSQSQGNIDKYREQFHNWRYNTQETKQPDFTVAANLGSGSSSSSGGMILQDSSNDGEDDSSMAAEETDCTGYYSKCRYGMDMDERSRHSSIQSESSSRTTKVYGKKDEKLAREAGISFSIMQIVGLPMDEFNDLLSRHDLTEEQLNLCRDIRRRGKNKVAAQNCRRRKLDQVEELEKRLKISRDTRQRVLNNHQRMLTEYGNLACKVDEKLNEILIKYNYDPTEYTIQNVHGELKITRKPNPPTEPEGSLRPKPMDQFYLKSSAYNYQAPVVYY
jgi:hypothetical protein